MSFRARRSLLPAAVAALVLSAACGDDITAPEVIEDTQFAESLNIDLSAMTRTASGLYLQTLVIGTGEPAGSGNTVAIVYTGSLSDGTVFDAGGFDHVIDGPQRLVAGFEEALLGMRAGEVRLAVIPPSLGYGDAGQGPVPPGAIMVFQIEVTSVTDVPSLGR